MNYERTASEKGNVKFRRSLYFVKNANEGDQITEEMVKSIRPGYGFAPKYLPYILGKPLLRDVLAGQATDSTCVAINLG